MTKEEKPKFVDKKKLAEWLGLSVYTIDTWVSQRREIPFVRMGDRVMFDVADVLDWIDMNKVRPTVH